VRDEDEDNGAGMISDAARRRYQAIVPPHVDEAFALARWLSGSAAGAEDIVQEAALRALNALETAIVERPRAWFLRIVRNAALTWMAKNRSQPLAFAGGVDDLAAIEPFDPNCDQRSPEALLIAAEDGERVRRAIAALAPALREALVLREINGLAYREIADATETPIGTVMSRLARARATLAKILEDQP
jgi:RNA polymerase sigma-70 factor (ECF subfamily)